MGEKVYVTSGPPIDPPPRGAQPTEPLNYARTGLPPRWAERLEGWVRYLGGWPQVIFSLGVGIVLAAFTFGLAAGSVREIAAFWVFVGAVLIGIVLRVPLRRDW